MASPPPSPTILYDAERNYFARSSRTSRSGSPTSPTTPRPKMGGRRRSSAGRRIPRATELDYGTNECARDTLAPPDVTAILDSKRRRTCGTMCGLRTRSTRVTLMCASVLLSAVQANGVYCWPTYGPIVQQRLGLSGTETQTIVVGGILGVYLCAAPMGALVDRCGPQWGSLMSALVASVGYWSFAFVLGQNEEEGAAAGTYLALTACFFLVGAATVGSYFAALTTASLSFPQHRTLSLSIPLACMGLSSLFLSSFSAIPIFIVDGELDAIRFLVFLGLLSLVINVFAAMFMRVVPPEPAILHDDVDSDSEDGWLDHAYADYADLSASLNLDERSPLIIGGVEAAREDVEAQLHGKVGRWTVVGLSKNVGFWAFGLVLAGCIGPSETIMATFGNIVTAVLPPPDSLIPFTQAMKDVFGMSFSSPASVSLHLTADTTNAADTALHLRNKHVFILSIASTGARLATGILADYLAPPPVAVPAPSHDDTDPDAPTHYFVQRDPIRMYRSMFAAICSGALALVFAWAAAWLDREGILWVLSFGVGCLYGAIFTLSPSIVSTHFGPTNFGLAWGMISYFPALGSAVFSYAYAFLATPSKHSANNVEAAVCYGRGCFDSAFWVAAVGCAASAVGLAVIGRRWKV